jgi:hypothetical protein
MAPFCFGIAKVDKISDSPNFLQNIFIKINETISFDGIDEDFCIFAGP